MTTMQERIAMLRNELERIEAEPGWIASFPDEAAEQLARVFMPELFAVPPTHWLAPLLSAPADDPVAELWPKESQPAHLAETGKAGKS